MKFTFYLHIFALLLCKATFAQQSSSVFATRSPPEFYVGGVMNKADTNGNDHKVLNLLDDNVTISFDGLALSSTSYKASKNNMYSSLSQSLSASVNPIFQNNVSFSYNLKSIKEYKEIENYLGQTIDTYEWFGIEPDVQRPKTLFALDIKKVAFAVHLDLPSDGSFITYPEIRNYNMDDLIYINSLSFGRRVIVLVESNLESGMVNTAIRNAIEGNQLSDQDETVIANCVLRLVVFGNEEITLNPDFPFQQIIDYMVRNLTKDDFGLPISFSAAYLKSNRVFDNMY